MLDRFLIALNAFCLGYLVFGTPPPGSLGATSPTWWFATPVAAVLVLLIGSGDRTNRSASSAIK